MAAAGKPKGGARGGGSGGGGTTSCPNCRKRYPWRDSLAGKKVKCKCGNVFEAALDLEDELSDHDDRTYDVAQDYVAPMEPVSISTTAPPVTPTVTGSVADAYPQRKSKVLTYAHARPAEAAELRDRSILREWYLPIGILGVGIGAYILQITLASGGGGTPIGAVGAAVLAIALEIVLSLVGVGVSSKLMSIDFGAIPDILLKVIATSVLGSALWALTVSIFPKDDMNGPIIALHVVVILYWVLFYTFFDMDLQECVMTVAIITAFHIAAFCIVFKPMG
jgi:hypothetical protein